MNMQGGHSQPHAAPPHNGILHHFKGIDYIISINSDATTLQLRVEEQFTLETWTGEFDVAYIEELSRKTGSYKSFAVFSKMLLAAVGRTNETVRLDLLTYSDLETLRKQKSGGLNTSSSSTDDRNRVLSKRYLIMTFSSEFDRIHYPLPLTYTGKPDTAKLQAIIRGLHKNLAEQSHHVTASDTLVAQLQAAASNLQQQLDAATSALQQQQQQQQQQQHHHQHQHQQNQSLDGSKKTISKKDLGVLKKIITRLESDLVTERTKYQRTLQKKQDKIQQLASELKEARDSERNLQLRCRNLSEEYSTRRRQTQGVSPKSGTTTTNNNNTTTNNNSARSRVRVRARSISNDRNRASHQSACVASKQPQPLPLPRSRSRRSLSNSVERLTRGERPAVHLRGRAYSRSPSPGRFNPTEYVKAREEKLQAARAARESKHRRGRSSSPRSRSRSPHAYAHTNTNTSTNTNTDTERRAWHTPPKPRASSRSSNAHVSDDDNSKRAITSGANNHNHNHDHDHGRGVSPTADPVPQKPASEYFQHQADITDIDARLAALQQFLHSAQVS